MELIILIACICYIIHFYFFDNFKLSSVEMILQRIVFSYSIIGFMLLGIVLILCCNLCIYIKYVIYAIYGIAIICSLINSVIFKLILMIIYKLDKKTAKKDENVKISFFPSISYLTIIIATHYFS